jgi:hypothetical protein
MNRYLNLGMMTTTGFWSPSDKAQTIRIYQTQFHSCHPKSIFSILTEKQGTSIPGDNMDEIRNQCTTQT